MTKLNKEWTTHAERALLNKRIIKVEYMPKKEAENYMWGNRPITFMLDDGTRIIPQADDEGNDGGALWFGNNDEESIMPVLRGDD
jgi:hypothetical protein